MVEGMKERVRAQVGIGTLIVFIAMVLVAAIAAGVLINTAGFLQSSAESTGQQGSEQVTNRLQVLEAVAEQTDTDNDYDTPTIGGVKLTVTKAPGAEDIALTKITMQWVGDTGTYDLVHEDEFKYSSSGDAQTDGAFAHEPIKDEDDSLTGSSPVINNHDDRAVIAIDVGRIDIIFEDNSINEAYDNHTYDIDTYEPVDESTALDDLLDEDSNWVYYHPTTSEDGTPLSDEENSDELYIGGKVIREDVTNDEGEPGLGLKEGETARLRITTASGTSTTVQLTVPESLSGKTGVRL